MNTAQIEIAELHPYEGNPRRGNVEAIAESLRVNGQYKPIVVNIGTHTGRPNEILAGHHLTRAAESLGWDAVEAVLVDVDDDAAKKIVLADNRTADLATYDTSELIELLDSLAEYEGTGYTEDDLDDLAAQLEELTTPKHVEPTQILDTNLGKNAREHGVTGDRQYEGGSRVPTKESYELAARRMMVIEYSLNGYVWLVDGMKTYADANGLNSNAAVVARLLAEALDTEEPEDLF